MRVYFISGLGADRRAFRHIALPVGFEAVYLEWFAPLSGETLEAYAGRMSAKIDTREPFVIIGLSMGGMIATEISKITAPLATILISSIPISDALPKLFKVAGFFGCHRWIPISWLKSAVVLKRFFMVESPQDRAQIISMVREADPEFIRWAFRAVLNWRNKERPQRLFHIHGGKDEIFPFRLVKPTHVVPSGRHLMVLNHSSEVNELLGEILSKIRPV